MQTQDIIYQHAPQFLPRLAIKLENMLASIYEGHHETHPIIHHYSLKNIIELLKIIEKPELKSRLTKEFLRLNYILPTNFKHEHPKLHQQFTDKCQELQNHTLNFGNKLQTEPFLIALKMRSQDQWNECELQAPYLFNWLHQKAKVRQEMLTNWLKELKDIQAIVKVYSSVLQQLAIFQNLQINQSFYQQTLHPNPLCQLIILKINTEIPVIPKFQVSSHALSIHFNDRNNLDSGVDYSFKINLGLVRI